MTLTEFIRNDRARAFVIMSAIVYTVCLVIHFLVMDQTVADEVQNDYYPVAEAMFTGHTPYHPYNDLAWEYPPLALIVMFIPRLFASDPMGYQIVFDTIMLLMSVFETVLVYHVLKHYGRDPTPVMVINLILMTMLWINGTIPERFDLIPAVICLLSVMMYLEKRYPAAFILAAAGMLVKVYPGLLLFAFTIPFLARKDMRPLTEYVSAAILTILSVMGIFYVMCSNDLFTFITYHSDRGIQAESLWGSVISVLSLVGIGEPMVQSTYGSLNLVGPLPDLLVPVIMPVVIITILLTGFVQYRVADDDEKDIPAFSLLYILIFILLNKVLSAQYIVWLIPMVVLFFASREWDERSWEMAGLSVSFTLMTMVIMLCSLFQLPPWTVMLVFVRNMLILASVVCLAMTADIPGRFKRSYARATNN